VLRTEDFLMIEALGSPTIVCPVCRLGMASINNPSRPRPTLSLLGHSVSQSSRQKGLSTDGRQTRGWPQPKRDYLAAWHSSNCAPLIVVMSSIRKGGTPILMI
jgi:hypothetical protein